jgi:hypothetical protein
MANTFDRQGLTWVGGAYDNPCVLDDKALYATAGQTFKAGDLVYITSGAVSIWGDHATTGIAGISLDDAATCLANTTNVRILKVRAQDEFECTLDGISALTSLGVDYGLIGTSNMWTAVLSDTTGPRVRVIEFVYGPRRNSSGVMVNQAIGDTNQLVKIKFKDDTNALGSTPLLQLD